MLVGYVRYGYILRAEKIPKQRDIPLRAGEMDHVPGVGDSHQAAIRDERGYLS